MPITEQLPYQYQWFSNQTFKHNSAQFFFLNLTLTLSFGSRFRMLMINGYDKQRQASKKKILVVPGLFN